MDIDLRFDALAAIMSVLVLGIGALVLFYCADYFHHHDGHTEKRLPSFAAELVAFSGAMFGLVVSDNMLVLYVFWELTTVLSFLLVGHYAERATSRRAATAGAAGDDVRRPGDAGRHRHARQDRRAPICCPNWSPRRRSGWRRRSAMVLVLVGALSSRRSCRCTSGCPARWPRRHRSAPTCTPPRWSRPACI